jgi:hypothetical protein
MPSVSQRQHNFFEAVAHSPRSEANRRVSRQVALEFVAADQAAGKFKKKKAPHLKRSASRPRMSIDDEGSDTGGMGDA